MPADVEGQRRPHQVGGPLDVIVDDGGSEGDDLEVVGPVTGTRPGEPLGQGRLEGLDGVGREEDGEPAVGDLRRQGHILRSLRPHDDGDLRSQWVHDGLEGLSQSGAAGVGERVVGTVVGHRPLAGHHLADDVHVLAGPGQRLLERLAVPALDHLWSRHPEPEHESASGQMVERDGGHAHGRRGPGRQLAQSRARGGPS